MQFFLGIFSVILSFQRGRSWLTKLSLLLVGLMVTFKYIYQVIFTLTSVIGKNNKFHQFFIGETIFCLLFWLFFVSIQNHDDNDALRYLVLFVQFKKLEKYPWKVNFTYSNTPPWVFFTIWKLYKWYQIAQNITIIIL